MVPEREQEEQANKSTTSEDSEQPPVAAELVKEGEGQAKPNNLVVV
jgi:hypothetical protein